MKFFEVKNNKVQLHPTVLLVPEFKAIMEEFGDDGLNALTFCNFMVNPDKADNPYLETREEDKALILKKDFPGKYKSDSPSVKAAIARLKDFFFELPEDRMYRSAKSASEKLEKKIAEIEVDGIKEMKLMMDVLKQVEAVTNSLSKTRELRETARTKQSQNVYGQAKLAYDQINLKIPQ
jgi:hypothetical protein